MSLCLRGRPSFSSFTQVYREYSFQHPPPPPLKVYRPCVKKWWSYDRVPYSWYKHSMRDMTIPGCVGWRLHKAPEGADHLFMVSQDKDNDQRKTFLKKTSIWYIQALKTFWHFSHILQVGLTTIIIFYYLEKAYVGSYPPPPPPPAYGLYARVNDENDGRPLSRLGGKQ